MHGATSNVSGLIMGTSTSTDNFGHWIILELVLLMSRSHQTFRPVSAERLMGIMFRNRCSSTTVHTITAEDVDGWMVPEAASVISPSANNCKLQRLLIQILKLKSRCKRYNLR
jgi:hypothetical protein